jgi:hypothetical protein
LYRKGTRSTVDPNCDPGAAEPRRTRSNTPRQEILKKWVLADVRGRLVVEGGAMLACARGQYEEAARLYAAAIPQRNALWDVIDPQEYERRARDLETLRAALGERTYTSEFTEGATSSLDEALDVVHFRVLDNGM